MGAIKSFLLPGEIAFKKREHELGTLLGSCVAVCLYDVENKWGGMNHYMLPEYDPKMNIPENKFGDQAIYNLIQKTMKAGSRIDQLKASIYGGAEIISKDSGERIGKKNIAIAKKMLSKYSIQIVQEDLGGDTGQRIYMNTASNIIRSNKIKKSENLRQGREKTNKFKNSKIKVLVIDDSSMVRRILSQIISTDEIEVVGQAADPYQAREMILETDPDVLCLDVIMPRMDGYTFLKKIMKYKPIPTIIISTIAKKDSRMYNRLVEAGAVHVIDKESLHLYKGIGHQCSAKRTSL